MRHITPQQNAKMRLRTRLLAAVLAVATIDYGEDTAGLYSKFKQDKSQ